MKTDEQAKNRFAAGAKVRVRLPGVNGTVKHVEDEPQSLGECWHKIETADGERFEPGCNLELIPAARRLGAAGRSRA